MTFSNASVDILTIDADNSLLAALRAALPAENAQLRAVRGFEEARAACVARLPELLFVDLGPSPSQTASTLCRRLHDDPLSSQLPIVAFGAFEPSGESLRELLQGGAVDFVFPPYEPAWLKVRLGVHLESVRSRKDLRREQLARMAAEEESRAAHRAKSDLLASMGHEIRTPMTAILGMSHLALQSGLNPKQRNYVEKVERSAELLLGTLNDILDSSRIDAGTLELQKTPFELTDLLDSVGRLVALRAEDRGLELLFDLQRDLPHTLLGDMARLAQVLVNLGLDAVRFGQHGEVVIAVEAIERTERRALLRFSVRDNGGRGEGRPAIGSDLGATLSQQLLQLMGSQLQTTAAEGAHGVQFTVDFDLPEAKPAAQSGAATPFVSGGARALVVDDNTSARRILLSMCSDLGLQAEAARDGWEALRTAAQAQRQGQPFELVLLDWKMPGMDGIECAHHLLAAHPRPPAILMLTAFGQHEAMQRLSAQRVSVQGVLSKPVTQATLGTAIASAMRRGPSASPPPDRTRSIQDHAAPLRGARILLVEDNAIIQELALELLSSAGMLVSLAENGREALERLGKQSFDGVLMDCQMPVLDGYETTRALRAMPHLKDLPVIALTANALEGDRNRVIAAGMNDHIAKPFDVALLFETLSRWVRPSRPSEAPVAPTPPVGADDPLLRLPGIDAKVGRSSTMNNDKLYRRLLGMFRDGQRDVVAQFRAARQAGDDAAAMRLAHNLRAVSASLGATAVQQSAGALERACADKSPDTTVEPLLMQVQSDLDPVIAGLSLLLPA